jgi:hypothetical protein
VHLSFGLADETKGASRSFLHPRRQWRALDHANQLAHVAVRGMTVVVAMDVRLAAAFMGVAEIMGLDVRRSLEFPAGQSDVYLDRSDAAPRHSAYLDGNLGDPQSLRQRFEPIFRCSCCNQGSEEHVTADAGGRIEDSETAILHRLTISPRAGEEANPTHRLRYGPTNGRLVNRLAGRW